MGKNFYFNEDADDNHKMKEFLPMAKCSEIVKDNIVVVLDTDKMIENNKFSLASNITYKSLLVLRR